jgi:chemotaxis protein MotB
LLTKDYGFDPDRITASGKGLYQPVKTNDTPEGRAANRRTEVILSPDLNELYEILYQ